MTIFDAILLGLVQGITEFLPISSSGHLIIARDIFGFTTEGGLAFDAVLQLATALAILVYFGRDVWSLIKRFWGREENAVREVTFLTVATIPAIFLGVLFESFMETTFRNSLVVAGTLVTGAVVMWVGEWWVRHQRGLEIALTPARALGIGFFQSLALIPGMSRSGMTITGGLIMGLCRESATRFAFLLGIPILLGSGGKKLADILSGPEGLVTLLPLFWGSVAAFVVGLVVIHYLLKYLRTHTLMVFVWYRIGLSVVLVLTALFSG